MPSYYAILEIEDFADIDEIKAAHRRLSKKYHPDLNNGSKYSEEKFKEVQHAYEQLRDPFTKAIHDSQLNGYYREEEPIDSYTYTYTPAPPTPWWRKPSAGIFLAFAFISIFRIIMPQPWKPDRIEFNKAPMQEFSPDTLKKLLQSAVIIDTPKLAVPGKTFKIGSSKEAVRQAQGAPLWVTQTEASEMWTYGNSVVVFRHDTVFTYNNISKNLSITE